MISYQKICEAWDRFFFQEKTTEGLALFRILWMGMIFCYFVLDLGNVNEFYGPHAVFSLETVREQFPGVHANLFHLFRPGYDAVYFLLGVYGVSLLFSVLGLFTRPALVIAFLCMTSFHQRSIWMLSSAELLMRSVTFLLIFSPCGHSLSIDSLLGRYFPSFKNPRTWPVWSLRLIQIQVSVVYLWTFWHKLKGDTWIDGTAVYYATRLEHLSNYSIPFLMDSEFMLKLMTWGTLLVELSLGLLIWVKEFRRPVIIVGVFFHLSIEYFMSIPFFELSMIILLINFFTPEELSSAVKRIKHTLVTGTRESSISLPMKEKIIRTIRGQA